MASDYGDIKVKKMTWIYEIQVIFYVFYERNYPPITSIPPSDSLVFFFLKREKSDFPNL